MGFSGYHLRSDVLRTMKEAAGNYMPDYGNWRVRLSTPQPEDPVKAEENAQDETVQPQGEEQEMQSGMMEDSWGEEGETVNEFAKNCYAADGSRKEGHVYTNSKGQQILCSWNDENYDPSQDSVHDVTVGSTKGGVKRTYDIDPTTGEYINVVDEYYGEPAPEGYTPFPKRSPFYSKYENNPYADVDKFLASQSNKADINGSIGTKATHDHVKNIVKDLKDNVFFATGTGGGNNIQFKKNKAEATAILGKISNSVKADIGPDGSISTLHDAYKGNLLSASTTDQEKFIFAHLFQMNDVKPAINDDNHLVYPIKMPTGETFPVTSQWINDTIEKRIKPFTVAAEFNNSKNNFFENGRAGNEWNPDAVIMNSKKLVDQNPNRLASLLLDDNLFTSEPLINHILRAKAPNADINPKEFVFNALNNEDTRKELEDDFARGLEKIARDSWERGNRKYREENNVKEDISNLNAQQLLAKYGKA